MLTLTVFAESGSAYANSDTAGIIFLVCVISALTIFGWRIAKAIVKGQPKTNQASLFHKSVSRMTGEEFEKYCADYLRRHGYWNVKCTPLSGDYGADIIAHKNGKKWVFQCKRYSKKVGNKAVQEVVAAKVHYGASEAGIMTNSELTPNAKKLAYENKVVIYEKIW